MATGGDITTPQLCQIDIEGDLEQCRYILDSESSLPFDKVQPDVHQVELTAVRREFKAVVETCNAYLDTIRIAQASWRACIARLPQKQNRRQEAVEQYDSFIKDTTHDVTGTLRAIQHLRNKCNVAIKDISEILEQSSSVEFVDETKGDHEDFEGEDELSSKLSSDNSHVEDEPTNVVTPPSKPKIAINKSAGASGKPKPIHVISREEEPDLGPRTQSVKPESLKHGMLRVDPKLFDREQQGIADVKMNIPKSTLLTFDGTDESLWKPYWETFMVTIHNTNLPDIQKMNHLVNSLKGPAKMLVSGYILCNEHYELAKRAVEDRYGDPKVQLVVLRKKLANWRFRYGKDPRLTIDELEMLLIQLNLLGEDIDHYSHVDHILENLPKEVASDLEMYRASAMQGSRAEWKMPQLRLHLRRYVNSKHRVGVKEAVDTNKARYNYSGNKGKKRSNPRVNAAILEERDPEATTDDSEDEDSDSSEDTDESDAVESKVTCAMVNTGRKKKVDKQTKFNSRRSGKKSSANAVTTDSSAIKFKPKFPCLMCDQSHFSDKCSTYKELAQRVARFREKNRCFICGKPGHMSKNCPDSKRLTCFICKRSGHHRALCRKLFNLPFKPKAGFKPKVSVSKVEAKESCDSGDYDSFKDFIDESDKNDEEDTDPEAEAVSQNLVHSLSVGVDIPAVMLTANTKIRNAVTKKQANVNLFFDTGGMRSFLSSKTANKLQLIGSRDDLSLYTFGSEEPIPVRSETTTFEIFLKGIDEWVPIKANTINKLSSTFTHHPFSSEDISAIKNIGLLANEKLLEEHSFTPNLMLGVGYTMNFLNDDGKHTLPSGLSSIPSKLGWVIGGNVKDEVSKNANAISNAIIPVNKVTATPTEDLQKIMNDYFSLEGIGIHDSGTDADDDKAIAQFEASICADSLDPARLSVGWPKNENYQFLPSNFKPCKKRFFLLNGRFVKNRKYFESYRKVIRQQIDLGIIELVTPAIEKESEGQVISYLAHHGVVKETRLTSKVRVVYDASMKSSRDALSLNDCLYKGPTMLPDLCGMLFRFRFFRYLLLSDLEKAFLMVGLNPEDRNVTRFLWYKDDEKPIFSPENIVTYRFTRVIFGVLSSPYLLNHTIKYCLMKNGSDVANLIANNIYVDNLLLNIDGPEEGLKIYHETKKIFSDIRMNATAWNSNCPELMKQIPEDDIEPGEVHKVLGLQWDVPSDTIHLSLSYSGESPDTKRKVLKYVASIYDPLGLLCPVLLTAKTFMQKLCNLKLTWDTPLSEDLKTEWGVIQTNLCKIPNFILPRHAGPDSKQNIQVDLHSFVDASEKAYAAIVYCRVEGPDNVIVHFVFAKTRISPIIKTLTLPRLELLANLIGKRAIDFVARELHIPVRSKTMWTDSEICLHWIKSTKVLSTFVANRVREITATDDIQFRYIGTADNPADVASRGCSLDELKETCNYNKFFYGPAWLRLSLDQWPEGNIPPIHANMLDELNNEVKKTAVPFMLAGVKSKIKWVIDPTRFSSLQKMRNTTVYGLRYIANMLDRLRDDAIQRDTPLQFDWSVRCKTAEKILNSMLLFIWDSKGSIPITAIELTAANTFLDSTIQYYEMRDIYVAYFGDKKHQTMDNLHVFVDSNHVLHSRTRLENSGLNYDAIYPKLLSHDSNYTDLVIKHFHEKGYHCGANQTLILIKSEYWIPRPKTAIKRILNQCVPCRKILGGPFILPEFPQLPAARVKRSRVYENVGLDFSGPFLVKVVTDIADKKGVFHSHEEVVKVYLCLFTCLASRAVHIEITYDMSTQAFVHCFRRFVARCGKPALIISDSAPTFKQFKETLQDAIEYDLAKDAIVWKLNVPFSPYKGGVWERIFRTIKTSLKKVLGRKVPIEEEFRTMIYEIVAIVNSRPLTYVSNEFDAINVLRPQDFITPFADVTDPVAAGDVLDYNLKGMVKDRKELLQFWSESQKWADKFWHIWQVDYLTSLNEIYQRKHKQPRVKTRRVPKLDEVVLLYEAMLPRNEWHMGRVIEHNYSADNQIRSVQVLLPSKRVVDRPLDVLYPLEMEPDSDDSEEDVISVPDDLASPPEPDQHSSVDLSNHDDLNSEVYESDLEGISPQSKQFTRNANDMQRLFDDDVSHSDWSYHVKTKPLRGGAINMNKMQKIMMILIVLPAIIFTSVSGEKIPISSCEVLDGCFSENKLDLTKCNSEVIESFQFLIPDLVNFVDGDKCVKDGITVFHLKPTISLENHYCFSRFKCGNNQMGNGKGGCDLSCIKDTCPSWAYECSYPHDNTSFPAITKDQEQFLNEKSAEVQFICGLKPSKNCSSIKTSAPYYKILVQTDVEIKLINMFDLDINLQQVDFQINGKRPLRCHGTPAFADWETRARLDGMSIGGDIHFCNEYPCTRAAEFFCWFPSQSAIILSPAMNSHSNRPSANIPILAWGMDSLQFYPYKDAEKVRKLPNCQACSLKCIKGGIHVSLKANRYLAINTKHLQIHSKNADHTFWGRSRSIGGKLWNLFYNPSKENIHKKPSGFHTIEACIEPFCYQIQSPPEENQFYFPGESTISDYRVTVKVWSHGVIIDTLTTTCKRQPFCEQIDCVICVKLLLNPECMPLTVLFFLFVILYLLSVSTFCFYYFTKTVVLLCIKLPTKFCNMLCNCNLYMRKFKRKIIRAYRNLRNFLLRRQRQRQQNQIPRLPREEEQPLVGPHPQPQPQRCDDDEDDQPGPSQPLIPDDVAPPEFFYVDGDRHDRNFRTHNHVMLRPKIMNATNWQFHGGPVNPTRRPRPSPRRLQFVCELDTDFETDLLPNTVSDPRKTLQLVNETIHPIPLPSPAAIPVALPETQLKRPSHLNLSNLFVYFFIAICLFQPVLSCVEFTLLQATMDECSLNERNTYECNINQVSRLALAPQNGDACLIIKNPLDEVIGSLFVTVQNIRQICRKRTLYFTRSYSMKTFSEKKCSGSGSCYEGVSACNKFAGKSEFGIPELQALEQYPGYSECSASCGCAACGCGFCTPGCLLYRYYATPVDPPVYEVFECSQWSPYVNVTLRFLSTTNSTSHSMQLFPGIKTQEFGVDITLISLINPMVPMLTKKFLTDGVRYAAVDASPPGGNLVGLIGALQCGTHEKASTSNLHGCTLPLAPCHCTELKNEAACRCHTIQIDDMFLDQEKALPLSMYGFSLISEEKNIYAQYTDVSSYELQLHLKGKRLASHTEKYQCTIDFISLMGCFNCISGAITRYICSSSHGETVANVFCSFSAGEDIVFSAVCSENPIELTSKLSFDRAIIDITCKVKCTGGTSTFRMHGNLAFIENIRYGNISAAISSVKYGGNTTEGWFDWLPSIDLGIFGNLMFGRMFSTILGFALMILLLYLTVRFRFPYLARKGTCKKDTRMYKIKTRSAGPKRKLKSNYMTLPRKVKSG